MAGKNLLNSVKIAAPSRNFFDLSHDVKMSFKMGELIPSMVLDCVPGDKINLGCESLMRLAPMIAPLMHHVNIWNQYFFIPKRLLWPNWENYITNTKVGGVLPAHPTWTIDTDVPGSYFQLLDYMGIPPPPVMSGIQEIINPMAVAAYLKVWNEYYRDQNLSTEKNAVLTDGSNNANTELTVLRLRAYEHDYFTACLPFAQKGDAVNIPIAGFNNVPVRVRTGTPGATTLTGTPSNVVMQADTPGGGFSDEMFAMTEDLEIESATINDLRRAFRLQEFLEKNARGGSRYIENILVHFGVKSSDQRLQRPEYITGNKSPIVISEVLNTTGTAEAPQGNMAGHGIGVVNGKYGRYFCEEHGYIICMTSVLPRTAYQDGIPKHFLKVNDPFEHYWPSFAHLGEQAVQNREIYAYQGITGADTFGYLPVYTEYKFENNRVAGEFRDELDFWHLGRKFATAPALNETFIMCDPDNTTRIFAVQDNSVDKIYAQIYHTIKAFRAMPKFGTPSF